MCRHMQWRQTILALSIRACTLGQENLWDWQIAVLGCNVKWSKAFLFHVTQTHNSQNTICTSSKNRDIHLRIYDKVSKQCIAVYHRLSSSPLWETHMPYGINVLPATRQWWESRLYPQPKQVLGKIQGGVDLCGWELNPRPVNRKSNAL